jgi:hypothetical protein
MSGNPAAASTWRNVISHCARSGIWATNVALTANARVAIDADVDCMDDPSEAVTAAVSPGSLPHYPPLAWRFEMHEPLARLRPSSRKANDTEAKRQQPLV